MWGGDSSGRRVSLLNHDHSPSSTTSTTTLPLTRPKLPERSRHPAYSSSSSFSSSSSSSSSIASSNGSSFRCLSRSSFESRSSGSPPTPPLTRLDSSSSVSTKSSSSSPLTPNHGPESMDHHQQPKQDRHSLPFYPHPIGKPQAFPPPVPDPSQQIPLPYYQLPGQQPLPPLNPLEFGDPYVQPNALHRLQTSQISPVPTALSPSSQPSLISPANSLLPTSASSLQAASLPSASIATSQPASASASKPAASASVKQPTTPSNPAPKKKYPCPHAATYNCGDTFTTSGHAARHGKKHTGEKNVHCPTCHKAFTRKDNMKQHERTHKGSTVVTANPTTSTPAPGNTSSASPPGKPATTRSRHTSVGTESAGFPSTSPDAMDLDPVTSPLLSTTTSNSSGTPSRNERPKMPRSELSEILENVNNGSMAGGLDANVMRGVVESGTMPPMIVGAAAAALGMGMNSPEELMASPPPPGSMAAVGGIMHGLPEVEVEGESPGLDALAMAAGAVV